MLNQMVYQDSRHKAGKLVHMVTLAIIRSKDMGL